MVQVAPQEIPSYIFSLNQVADKFFLEHNAAERSNRDIETTLPSRKEVMVLLNFLELALNVDGKKREEPYIDIVIRRLRGENIFNCMLLFCKNAAPTSEFDDGSTMNDYVRKKCPLLATTWSKIQDPTVQNQIFRPILLERANAFQSGITTSLRIAENSTFRRNYSDQLPVVGNLIKNLQLTATPSFDARQFRT